MHIRASFIVATYGRAEVLDATLRSLILQDRGDWEAIVVGDCCDEHTEAVVRALQDPRVRYYNLPCRYGEQGGPNSVGLAVARGELVTFLNHDDLLLPDHLDHVIHEFDKGSIDVLVTRSVKVRWFAPRGDDPPEIICGGTVPAPVRLADAFSHRMYKLEPASAWTVARSVALRVGSWRSSQTTLRMPFQEWLLRLARVSRRWRFDHRVTGLSLVSDYQRDAPEALALVQLLATRTPDEVRADFLPTGLGRPGPEATPKRSKVSSWATTARRPRRAFRRLVTRLDELLAPAGLLLYRRTGLDYGPLAYRVLRQDRARGRVAQELLAHRTGEQMPDHSSLAGYVADPEALRVI